MPQPPPDATEPSVIVEEPTDIDGRAGTFRDETTAAAETRTVKLGAVPPWLATADPELRPSRPRDPLFWPAVVFVAVLATSIAFMLMSQSGRRSSPGHSSGMSAGH